MKKILFLICLWSFNLQTQFVDFSDKTSTNRFLGLDIGMCKVGSDCGNDTVSGYLNVNLLSPGLLGQQFYLFNNFMYYLAHNQTDSRADTQPHTYFSGSGVFMIAFGTSSYLQKIVAPHKKCLQGQSLMCAQLKYNDGNSIASWSQDSICLSAGDTFGIEVSGDQDNSISPALSTTSSQTVATPTTDSNGVDWMRDAGPSTNYTKAADGSPRKVRLLVRSSAPVVQPASTVVLKNSAAKK